MWLSVVVEMSGSRHHHSVNALFKPYYIQNNRQKKLVLRSCFGGKSLHSSVCINCVMMAFIVIFDPP